MYFYRLLLRWHPRRFRERFGAEMEAVTQEAAQDMPAWRLTVDLLASLTRQWFQQWEPEQSTARVIPAGDAVPTFTSFETDRPGARSLVPGAVLSVLLMGGVLWLSTMRNTPLPVADRWHTDRQPSVTNAGPLGGSPDGAGDGRAIAFGPASSAPGEQGRQGVPIPQESLWESAQRWWKHSTAPTQVEIAGPAARALHDWIQGVNAANRETLTKFAQTARNQAPVWTGWKERHGPFTVRRIEQSTPAQITALAQTQDGTWWRLTASVVDEPGALARMRPQQLDSNFNPVPEEVPAPSTPVPVELSRNQLQAYAGRYVFPGTTKRTLVVSLQDGLLIAGWTPDARMVLIPTSKIVFQFVGEPAQSLEFRMSQQRVKQVVLRQGATVRFGRPVRVTPERGHAKQRGNPKGL